MKRTHAMGILLLTAVVIGGVVVQRLPRPLPAASARSVNALARAPMIAAAGTYRSGVYHASFERLPFLDTPAWRRDVPDRSTRFGDFGSFFTERHPRFAPPEGYRISTRFGPDGFLTLESYSRTKKDPKRLMDLVEDPDRPGHRVLRIASPEHTDGTIIRTTASLGSRYEICARVGYMDFGTGDGSNGYTGGEQADPWVSGSAMEENGFYFGAIVRSAPAPHNNLYAHHERIAFIDSDNNTGRWTSIWDPTTRSFLPSGWNPIVMGIVDGRGEERDESGPPFATFAADAWNPPGEILAVDAYKDHTWYTACFARDADRFTMRVSGDFRFGGRTTYETTLTDTSGVFHFHDPHYWFLGDPHINYYEGTLLVDEITLTIGDTRTSNR